MDMEGGAKASGDDDLYADAVVEIDDAEKEKLKESRENGLKVK